MNKLIFCLCGLMLVFFLPSCDVPDDASRQKNLNQEAKEETQRWKDSFEADDVQWHDKQYRVFDRKQIETTDVWVLLAIPVGFSGPEKEYNEHYKMQRFFVTNPTEYPDGTILEIGELRHLVSPFVRAGTNGAIAFQPVIRKVKN